MEVTYSHCCGIDVHKKLIVACLLTVDAQGHKHKEVRSFETVTQEILALADWLKEAGCTHIAIESTGVYWKPVFNILEGSLNVLLVNPRHIKAVPGRKTDVSDSEWLADLLQHGLLRASFIPPLVQRELRDLTRYRTNLVEERARLLNRIQKLLEDANLKLGGVVTDISGLSARRILSALAQGQTDPTLLSELACGALRKKLAQLERALNGRLLAHHCFILSQQLAHLDYLDEQVEAFNQQISQHIAEIDRPTCKPIEPNRLTPLAQEEEVEVTLEGKGQETKPNSLNEPAAERGKGVLTADLTSAQKLSQIETAAVANEGSQVEPLGYKRAITLLDSIPGVSQRIAEILLAEIGLDMSRFGDAQHLASWAGICPGNRESGGKRLSGRTRKGDRWLKQALTEAGQAAMRTKDSYLSSQGKRISARRGRKRAILAVGHSILVIAFYLLSRNRVYEELGGNYFDERDRKGVERQAVKRLEKLGFKVTLSTEAELDPKLVA